MGLETEISNLALAKLGGAGDQLNGNAFISDINDSNNVAAACKLFFPRVRRTVIIDLAVLECPFRATIRFAGLGTALSDDSVPEIGAWQCAFNLPGDCLQVISQFEESAISIRRGPRTYQTGSQVTYQWEVVADKDGKGKILLTNTLSNEAHDSAFIDFAIDTPETGSFTEGMIECIATLLAHSIAPLVGRDMESAAFLLQQYKAVAVPAAQAANQRGFNDTARIIPDYSGGRSKVLPHRNPTLGLGLIR